VENRRLSVLKKYLLYILIGIISILPEIVSAQVEITSFSQDAQTVGRYEKFELSFLVSQDYDNPFDTDIVDVTVDLEQPDGSIFTVPAFYYIEYDYAGDRYINGRNPCWKVRFAPSQLGEHKVAQVKVIDSNGTIINNPGIRFTCIESDEKSFIRRDLRDPHYLSHAAGGTYLPIGHNVCWLPDGPGDWEHYFSRMGTVGENWSRIWMTHFYEGQLLEWSSSHHSGCFEGVGRLSTEMAWKLDRMIEAAEDNGIAVQLVLQHHGQFSTTTDSNWNSNPYNIANAADGGFLDKPEEFFTDSEAIRLTKNKYRYIVARWGYSSAVLAWELWNEVQYTDGWRNNRQSVVTWHEQMADYIASIDPFDHPITTSSDSSGFDALWYLANIDVIQVHHYGAETISFLNSAVTRLADYGKPVIMGEFGVGRTGNVDVPERDCDELDEPYQTQMLEVLPLHNGMWSAFHLKSGAHLWWWDCYIEPLDLYGEFSALANYAAGEDPAAYNLSKADIDTAGLSKWVLASPGLSDFWAVSTRTEFTVEDNGTVPGIENLSSWLHGSSKDSYRSDPTFNIDLADGDVLKIHVQEVSGWGNNSLRVLVDSQQIFSSSYNNGSAGFVIEVPLLAGRHAVQIENTGQDWFNISGYEFTNTSRGCLEFIGLSGTDHAYIWVHDVDSRYGRIANGTFSNISVALLGLDDGLYVVEFYMTRGPGGIVRTDVISSEAGRLPLTIPDFTGDIAIKIRPYISN
jgi:hypothetical protein